MNRKKQNEEPPKRVELETFRYVGAYELGGMRQDEPSCFNGSVRVYKYRVTVERIEEPIEVIRERIKALYRACNNMHHLDTLHKAAANVGIELQFEQRGKDERK